MPSEYSSCSSDSSFCGAFTDLSPLSPSHSGYKDTPFAGKGEQAQEAIARIRENGFIPSELVEGEVTWFYENLGIDDQYFALEQLSTICDHITVSKPAVARGRLVARDSAHISTLAPHRPSTEPKS